MTYISLLILLTVTIDAQVNTEKYRTPTDLQGLAGYFELSGTVKTGNVDKTEAGLEGRLDWHVGEALTFFVFESDYEWVDGSRSSNEGLIHVRHVQSLSNKLRAEAFAQVNYDKKILIDNRELIGAGLRYTLFTFSNSDVTFGSAYMFEHENYDLTADAKHATETKVSRWSNYLTYHIRINEIVRIGGVVYYQPMFSEFSDYRLLYENNLAVKLTDIFSLSVNFKYRHDSIPPDGINSTDTKTEFGLAVTF
ncbi:MAG: DUF481 domain-containing protein [Melioribacteraceae bacterium]|nr:DUF481 domain-containing protein [Melioribacteraceae bacterium]